MNEELLQKLYNKYNLAQTGTFDQFRSDMQSPEVQQRFFTKYGLDRSGTFEQFQQDLGGLAPLPTSKADIDIAAELLPWAATRKKQIEASLPQFNSQQEADEYLKQINEGFKAEQQAKIDQLIKKYTPPLPTTEEPYSPPQEERSIFGIIPLIGDFIHYGGKAVERGFYQGRTADVLNPYESGPENAEQIAEFQRQASARKPSPAFQKFIEAEGLGDSMAAMAEQPLTVFGELIGQSLAAMATHGATRIPIGAAAGAGLGLTGLGVGAVPGAATGVAATIPELSYNLEWSGKIIESLTEMGVNVNDPDQLAIALSDPESMDKLKSLAQAKAIPIAALDALSAGLAGKFYSAALKKGGSKFLAGLKETGLQMGLGGGGELLGQISAGEKISPSNILAEMVGEIGTGGGEVAAGVTSRNVAQNAASQIATQLDPQIVQAQDQIVAEVQAAKPLQTVTKTAAQIQAEITEIEGMLGADATAKQQTGTGTLVPEARLALQQELAQLKKELSQKNRPNPRQNTVAFTVNDVLNVILDKIKLPFLDMNGGIDERTIDDFDVESDVARLIKAIRSNTYTKETLIGTSIGKSLDLTSLNQLHEQILQDPTILNDILIKIKNQLKDAQSVRSNEEQVPQTGPAPQEGKSESSSNLQQQAQEEGQPQNQVNVPAASRLSVPKTMVTVSEMSALKDQIRFEARAAREGAKVVADVKNDLFAKIGNVMDGLRLPARKFTTIANKVRNTNFLNPVQTARLINYVEKTANDVTYADKVQQAETLQKQLKDRLSRFTPEQRPLIQRLATINPQDVEIEEFISKATEALAPTQQVEGEKYAPLNTESLTAYVNKAEATSEEFISQNMESLPTDEEIDQKGPTVSVKLGQMATDRVNRLTEVVPKGTKVGDRILDNLKKVDLSKLEPKQLRDLVKIADNILINEDFGLAGELDAMLYALENAPKMNEIPVQKIWGVGNTVLGQSSTQFSTWLKRLMGTSQQAADIQAYSNISNVVAQNSVTEAEQDKFVKRVIKQAKTLGKDVLSHENMVFTSQFSELLQYTENETPQEGFDRAKRNIEQDLANKARTQDEDLATEQAQWNLIKDFNSPEELIAHLKAKYPKQYKMWEFLVSEFKANEEDFMVTQEAVYGTRPERVNNYIPLRTFASEDASFVEPLEDVREAQMLTNNEVPVRPKASKSAISRTKDIGEKRIRDRRLFDVVSDRYYKNLYDINVSLEVRRAGRTLGMASPELAKTGIVQAHNTMVQHQRGQPYISNELARAVDNVLRISTEIAYTVGLGGILPGVGQYSTATWNALSDLVLRGKNPADLFIAQKDMTKVLNQHPIGRRAAHMGGLDEVKQANIRLRGSFEKNLNKLFTNYEFLKSKIQPVVMFSQVQFDFLGAKQAWGAFYKTRLEELGGQFESWEKEAGLQNDDLRKRAAAYAEQRADELLAASATEKRAPVLATGGNVAARAIKATMFQFATYALNLKQRLLIALGNIHRVEGMRDLVIIMGEAYLWNQLLRPIVQGGGDKIYELIADLGEDMFGDLEPTDEEKERTEELRKKFNTQGFYKDLMPWAVNDAISDATFEFANQMLFQQTDEAKYMSYNEWKKDLRDQGEDPPFIVFEKPWIKEMGAIGMVSEVAGGITEYAEVSLTDKDTMIVTDTYGNEQEIYLDEQTKNVLHFYGIVNFLAINGINLREVTTAARKTRTKKIKDQK